LELAEELKLTDEQAAQVQGIFDAMVPAFDVALQGMEVGDITTEPVETPFGFHIIRKNAIPE